MTQDEKPLPVHRTIADRVRKLRDERGWSAQKLGEEMARFGASWDRSIVANFENGRRSYVTVEELLALGRALKVPPILLVFPFDKVRAVEVPPGAAPAWEMAEWFAGRAPFPRGQDRDGIGDVAADVGADQDLEAFEQGAVAVELWELHARHLAAWRAKEHAAELARRRTAREPDDAEAQQEALRARRTAETVVNTLREVRRRMRQHGILAPDLGPHHEAAIERGGDGSWTALRDDHGRQMFDDRGYRIRYDEPAPDDGAAD